MKQQRIFWFQDGAKFKTSPENWSALDNLSLRLINLIGHPEFEHVLVDPLVCAEKLLGNLNLQAFTCLLDLTGFFAKEVRKGFPQLATTDELKLSRLRLASSAKLDGVGHLLTLSPAQITTLKQRLDLSKSLIIDDVGWSGRTAGQIAEILGLNLKETTFGFLITNRGEFAPGVPAATSFLERSGARVVSGGSVFSPQDDGFHLEDFFANPWLTDPEVFGKICQIQELRESLGETKDQTEGKEFELKIQGILRENQQLLFPNIMTTEEVKSLQREGRLIARGGLPKNSFFTINPPNWLAPSFSKRVKAEMLWQNQVEITQTLRELHSLTEGFLEPKRELLIPTLPEGQGFWGGKERF